MEADSWKLHPGETVVREQIHPIYGGNSQAGISPSRATANVFVYSDHEKAAAYGYNFDHWDSSDEVFHYTGEGKVGDQVLARGNAALVDHQRDGRALRLFVGVGYRPGTATRIHQYVGEFAISNESPYITRTAPDINGLDRKVFVFRLVPVGAIALVDGL